MADILVKVKNALGITGDYHNETLTEYIDEIKEYLINAGVPEVIANSTISAGVISRGVTDIWNYGGGGGKLSEYFKERVIQLVYKTYSSKIIFFGCGDYGLTYPVLIEGIDILETDKIVFMCGEIVKEYAGIVGNIVPVTFTKEESAALDCGTYKWTMKLTKETSAITLINDGILVVS